MSIYEVWKEERIGGGGLLRPLERVGDPQASEYKAQILRYQCEIESHIKGDTETVYVVRDGDGNSLPNESRENFDMEMVYQGLIDTGYTSEQIKEHLVA